MYSHCSHTYGVVGKNQFGIMKLKVSPMRDINTSVCLFRPNPRTHTHTHTECLHAMERRGKSEREINIFYEDKLSCRIYGKMSSLYGFMAKSEREEAYQMWECERLLVGNFPECGTDLKARV
jgi:hypothetical protein